MKHSLKEWFAATRYWSFTVSTMPVVATFAYLCAKRSFVWGIKPVICFLLALVGVVALHAAGNLLSDYFDFKKGVDNEKAFAVPNLVFHNFEPKEYFFFSVILFALGCGIGLILTFICGWQLLIIGGIGVVLTALYSQLKFNALGDADIFVIFGILTVLGTTFVITGSVVWEALVLSVPLGIITVSVLHANNTLDIPTDGEAGIRTFAMLLGGKRASRLYMAYMILPFVCILLGIFFFGLPWASIISYFAIPVALKNYRQAQKFDELGTECMKGLDIASSQLHLIFSLLLSAGMLASLL